VSRTGHWRKRREGCNEEGDKGAEEGDETKSKADKQGEIIARLAFHSIVKNESETGLMLVRASRKMLGVQ